MNETLSLITKEKPKDLVPLRRAYNEPIEATKEFEIIGTRETFGRMDKFQNRKNKQTNPKIIKINDMVMNK